MQIDNSTLSEFLDCNVKGVLSRYLHRKPRVEGEASWFGKEFHHFPQYYWQKGDKWKEILSEFETRYVEFITTQSALGRLAENETIRPEVYLNMAKEFVRQVRREVSPSGEIILLNGQTGQPLFKVRHRPEISFKFPLGPFGDEYVGKIDTLLEDFSGYLWVADLKTTSKYRIDKPTGLAEVQFTWLQQFVMSSQLSGYIRGVQHNSPVEIAGAVIFALPRTKKPLKVTIQKFQRTEEALEKWERDVWQIAQAYKSAAQEVEGDNFAGLNEILPTGKWSGTCTRFGLCPYFEICKWNYAPGVIEATTIYAPWDPLAVEEEI